MSTVVITGGCGYVGTYLATYLAEKSHFSKIILFDIAPPFCKIKSDKIEFVKGDITKPSDLKNAFQNRNIKGVFHVAGYGMGGNSNLPAFEEVAWQVNVDGTQNVIDACLECNVEALVFTSTVNVVFNGNEILNGDENSHTWLEDGHLDFYSRTKHQAEKLVVQSNHQKTKDQKTTLRTCVLRMGGVYGPNEKTILARSLYLMSTRLGYFSFCHKKDLKIDFLHIDNAVQGHVKALDKLLKSETDEISGQIFYLTDDNPTNTFFFLDPLYTKIDPQAEHCPSVIGIPLPLLCFASLIFHCLSLIMGPKFKMPYWGFTIMEAYKINVNHYFSVEKAKRLLEYKPKRTNGEDWKVILDSLDCVLERK